MSLSPTNLIIQGSQLPAEFKGKPNDLFREMLARMRIVSPTGTSFFVTGDTEPTSNQGPWLKGGTEWWVFDPDLKKYVPLDISESETKWFQVGATTPTTSSPPVWLRTTENATEAAPVFGTPIAWYLFDGTTWKQLPVIIVDRSITQAKLDFYANFFATTTGINNYSISLSPVSAFNYGDGSTNALFCIVKFLIGNTGAVTLSVNGGGGAPVKKNLTEDLVDGEIVTGSVHLLVFDGTNFQILSPLADPNVLVPIVVGVAFSSGLIIKNTTGFEAFKLDIAVNTVELQNVSGKKLTFHGISKTVNIAASGLGGLDTGSEALSTWYYVYLVSNGTDVFAMLSLNDSGLLLPSGYTYFALIGAIFNDTAGDLIGIYQTGRNVWRVKGSDTISISDPLFQEGLVVTDLIPTIANSIGGVTLDTNIVSAQADSVGTGGNYLAATKFFSIPVITESSVYVFANGPTLITLSCNSFTI